jgi:hypothetical protein
MFPIEKTAGIIYIWETLINTDGKINLKLIVSPILWENGK